MNIYKTNLKANIRLGFLVLEHNNVGKVEIYSLDIESFLKVII